MFIDSDAKNWIEILKIDCEKWFRQAWFKQDFTNDFHKLLEMEGLYVLIICLSEEYIYEL